MKTRNASDCNVYSVYKKGEKMSPNSHPSKAGSVVESDVSYNSIVKGWQTTGDQVTTSGLESVRVMIRAVLLGCNSGADQQWNILSIISFLRDN